MSGAQGDCYSLINLAMLGTEERSATTLARPQPARGFAKRSTIEATDDGRVKPLRSVAGSDLALLRYLGMASGLAVLLLLSGRISWLMITPRLILTRAGMRCSQCGIGGYVTMLAENVSLALDNLQLREALRTLAMADPLTKLANRRSWTRS